MLLLSPFYLSCSRHHQDLHSFPTRRSSDLYQCCGCNVIPRKSADRKVKINACRNATNNSSRLKAVTPRTLPMVIGQDRKSTRLNSSHTVISYAVFCLKKKKRK